MFEEKRREDADPGRAAGACRAGCGPTCDARGTGRPRGVRRARGAGRRGDPLLRVFFALLGCCRTPRARRTPQARARAGQSGRSSSISVTRAAIGERSERVSVTCANSGCPLSALDHGGDAVVPAHPQVVPLGDVVGEHHPRAGAQPGQHGQQHAALERLRLVDDDERVVQRPPADVGQRQHLDQPAVGDLVEHGGRDQRAEGVVDRLRPGRHLLALAAGQVAELLAADGVQRPEDDHLLVRPPLHHRLQPRAQRQRRLAGAGPPAEGDDADLRVEEQVERDPLLGGAAVQPERLAVAAHQPHLLVRRTRPSADPREDSSTSPVCVGSSAAAGTNTSPALVQRVDLVVVERELGHAGPAGVDGVEHAVLVGLQADGGGLDPQRHVLGDQADVAALGAEVERHGHDPAVVAVVAEAGRQHRRVAVVELHVQRAALLADRHRRVEPAVRTRRSSSMRSDCRANQPSSGWSRLPSSSPMTTSGSTTSGSPKRSRAPGSDSRTEVSRTYVRRVVTCRLPWGARRAPARRRPGPGAGAGCRPPWSTNSSAPTGPPVDGEVQLGRPPADGRPE